MDTMQIPDGQLRLQIIGPQFIDSAWAQGADKLGEACKLVDEITGSQLKMMLSRGERTLVSMLRGEMIVGWGVFRIDQLPNMRVFFITDLYAKGARFDDYFGELKKMAAAFGCSRIRCAAQDVQERLYRTKCGFKPVYQVMETEV